jgi:hypothetical protein
MFSQILRDHATAQSSRRQRCDVLRKSILKHAGGPLSESLCDAVNERVAVLFLTQREIETQAKTLAATTQRLSKQAATWAAQVEAVSGALKELGDVEAWAEAMYAECTQLVSELHALQQKPS